MSAGPLKAVRCGACTIPPESKKAVVYTPTGWRPPTRDQWGSLPLHSRGRNQREHWAEYEQQRGHRHSSRLCDETAGDERSRPGRESTAPHADRKASGNHAGRHAHSFRRWRASGERRFYVPERCNADALSTWPRVAVRKIKDFFIHRPWAGSSCAGTIGSRAPHNYTLSTPVYCVRNFASSVRSCRQIDQLTVQF
jgi:hypothetical protein